MPSEAARKAMALEYVRRINAGDIDGVLDLFGDDIVFEDPVGRPPLIGKDALREHIALAVGARAHETPGPPVTSMDDRLVVTQTRVVVRVPAVMTFNIIGIVELDEDGLGRRVQAFWGMTDMAVGGSAGHKDGHTDGQADAGTGAPGGVPALDGTGT
ncbi:nuclear transport factor 2 family protein [Actinomadura graeca]|uniref:Nuclear transport factor 2 family protein n=1 Tax=Actinomadura graeca TaxID=2750812 RepID=A0ABX8R6S9_9ACTN|nr:nuclear transport factor 2 family protein [Actinomadura graeca]QXJ26134.1 nuclear transport factor 2 family protein [Actinomadura graeca]